MKLTTPMAAACVLAAAPRALAQDECTTATAVTGGDVVSFDTTTATPSATAWSCAGGGGPDLWYWITSTTGSVITIDACGSSYDTALEVFDGSCASLSLVACNDDACGLLSRIQWLPTAGTTYLFRVGGYSGSAGSGTFTVDEAPPSTPMAIVDDQPGAWVDIAATGTPLGLSDDGEVDVSTTVGNDVLPSGVIRVGSNGGIRFSGTGVSLGYTNQGIPSTSAFSGHQTLLPFWDDVNTSSGTNGEIYVQEVNGVLVIQWEAAGFFSSSDTSTFQVQVFGGSGSRVAQFLYEDVASPRADFGSSATIGFQSGDLGGFDDVQWSYNEPVSVMNGTVLTLVRGSGQIGTNYCTANPNSTGSAGVISATGSRAASENDLTLVATNLSPQSFGMFLVSPTQEYVQNPVGSAGNLCLGGLIGRYVGPGQIQHTGDPGEFSLAIDLTSVPTPMGSHSVSAGEILNFQAWHRDRVGGQATSNFTDGLEVTFE